MAGEAVKLTGVEEFHRKIRKLSERGLENAVLVQKKVTLDLYNRVTERSPVDTGRFKASWRIGIGRVVTSIHRRLNKNAGDKANVTPLGVAQHASHQRIKVAQADGIRPTFITNALPYSIRLEEGWSKVQAPLGMVRLAIIDTEFDLDRELEAQNLE